MNPILLIGTGIAFLLLFSSPTPPLLIGEIGDSNLSFLDLNDTLNSYIGQAGKSVLVNLDENGLVFLDVNGGGGFGDTNQVKISGGDTTPGYLEDKLSPGSNVTLTVLNPGANESIEISASGGGGGGNGTTYNSGTPGTIEVNNDTNNISQDFDGNFISRFDSNYYPLTANLFPVPDANLLDLSWNKLTNYPSGCLAGEAVQVIDDTLNCIPVGGSYGDANVYSIIADLVPWDYDVNLSNKPYIPTESDIDGNALSVINSLDLNNSLDYVKVDMDNNCSITGSCPAIAYQNTDVNFTDVNATILHAQTPGGTKFNYGAGSKGIEIPFPSGCIEVFGVEGFPGTGLQFCGSPAGIALPILGENVFFVFEGGDQSGAAFLFPRSTTASIPGLPSWAKGGVVQMINQLDGNHIYTLLGETLGWKQIHHSQYAPDFLLQTGDINNTSDKNQLRFLGNVDFNGGIDVNENSLFSQNITVDGNNINFNGLDINYNGQNNSTYLITDKNNTTIRFNGYSLTGIETSLFSFTGNGRYFLPNLASNAVAGQTINRNAGSGEIYVFSSSSDFKENIIDIKNDLNIHKYEELEWVAYNDIQTGGKGWGLIAEDVENVYPEAVLYDDKEKIVGVSYHTIAIIGSAYQKEMKNEFDIQKLLIQEQANSISKLENDFELLKNLVCPPGSIEPICLEINLE